MSERMSEEWERIIVSEWVTKLLSESGKEWLEIRGRMTIGEHEWVRKNKSENQNEYMRACDWGYDINDWVWDYVWEYLRVDEWGWNWKVCESEWDWLRVNQQESDRVIVSEWEIGSSDVECCYK